MYVVTVTYAGGQIQERHHFDESPTQRQIDDIAYGQEDRVVDVARTPVDIREYEVERQYAY